MPDSTRTGTQNGDIDFKRFAAEEQSKRDEAERERDRLRLALRPRRETKDAIAAVAYARADPLTGERSMDVCFIQTADWAVLIEAAARAWSLCPGSEVICREPRLEESAGMRAGKAIFLRAMERSLTHLEIKALLEQAYEGLGIPANGQEWQNSSVQSIVSFFRQLDRYYDGTRWAPPKNWDTSVENQNSWKPIRTRPLRNSLEQPKLDQVRIALASLVEKAEPSKWYSVLEVMELFGLRGISERAFNRSRQYMDLEQEHKAHRLPRASIDPNVAGKNGKVSRGWSRRDVLAALRGWEKKLNGGSTPF